jgi:hypothetical protein
MADNVETNSGSGGAIVATDDVGGFHYQRIKVCWGADGSANDTSSGAPLPVTVVSTTALTPGTAAANLGKAEDAAHSTGDTGVAALAVRRDTPAVGSGTDGDYSTLNVDASGYLYTLDKNSAALLTAAEAIQASVGGTLAVGSHEVTNAGTFAVQATIAAGATTIAKAEDAAHSSGDVGVPAMSVRQDTAAALAGTDADYQPLITDANGRLHVNVGNTVTVASHAVTNAGTFAVQAAQSGTWNIGDVSGTVSLPTGAATSAKQDTIIGHVDGIEGLLTTIDADTSALAGAVAGTEVQVDVVTLPALPAGANAIGTVTAVGAAAEDAAASGNPVLVGGRYDSSARTLETGDVGAIALNASGQVLVEIAAGAGSGGTAAADDADFTAGATSGTPVMGVYESTPTSVTDGDMGVIGITAERAMKVAIASGGIAGIAEDSASAGGEEGIMVLAVRRDTAAVGSGTDGDFSTLNVNATGRLYTSTTVDAALPAGTNNIGDVDVLTLPNVTLAAGTNTNEVVGDAAHGAAVAGNPLLTGLEGRSTAPTAVDDGDVVRALATLLGKQVVLPYALPANTETYASAAAVTDTADDEVFAAVASTRHYVTGIQVFNGHATTGTEVVIKDGSTVKWRGYAYAAGGGCSARFDPPLRGTANTAVNVANITNSSSTYFNLQGYQAAE